MLKCSKLKTLIMPALLLAMMSLPCFSQMLDKHDVSRRMVGEYLQKHNYPRPLSLEAVCREHQQLSGLTICHIKEGGSIKSLAGQTIITDSSHYSEWTVAFFKNKPYKLSGFYSENEFASLSAALNTRVNNKEVALTHMQLYLDLLYRDHAPVIVNSRGDLRRAYKQFGDSTPDPQVQLLLSDISRSRIRPLRVIRKRNEFQVTFFGLQEQTRRVSLKRFCFRVSTLGNVRVC